MGWDKSRLNSAGIFQIQIQPEVEPCLSSSPYPFYFWNPASNGSWFFLIFSSILSLLYLCLFQIWKQLLHLIPAAYTVHGLSYSSSLLYLFSSYPFSSSLLYLFSAVPYLFKFETSCYRQYFKSFLALSLSSRLIYLAALCWITRQLLIQTLSSSLLKTQLLSLSSSHSKLHGSASILNPS